MYEDHQATMIVREWRPSSQRKTLTITKIGKAKEGRIGNNWNY
jgi:hypothetical protein